ncbi:MAG: SDR family oxidoreductase [Dehalococcoidia bacterium]
MELGLRDKVAIVTGGSMGIGFEAARSLAEEGTAVAICARGLESLEAAAEEIRSATGSPVLAVRADMTQKQDIEKLVAEAVAAFGGVDILVLNAGTSIASTMEQSRDEDWEYDYSLSVIGAVRACRLAVPQMRQRGGGSIIYMAAVTAKAPAVPNIGISTAGRAAALNFVKVLANEVARDKIRVNAINLGAFWTPLVRSHLEERAREQNTTLDSVREGLLAGIPLGRLGQPQDAADLVAFLASDRAGYITGAAIELDGGWARYI